MISVVCWKWGNKYLDAHVERLADQFLRHLRAPHRFFCITDTPSKSLAGGVTWILAWPDWPSKGILDGKEMFRQRLRLFDPSVRDVFGERILQVDLDTVVVGDLVPVVSRSEPFVVWRQPGMPGGREPYPFYYNPSLILMDAGALPGLWDSFSMNPEAWVRGHADARQAAGRPGRHVGDQGILCHYLGNHPLAPAPATFTEADGVYRHHLPVPRDARVLMFDGRRDKGFLLDSEWLSRHVGSVA